VQYAPQHPDKEKLVMSAAKSKVVRTSVILPEKRHLQLTKLAEANDVSVAWVIRNAITDFLDHNLDGKKLTIKSAKE
jgi:hypothetical protein